MVPYVLACGLLFLPLVASPLLAQQFEMAKFLMVLGIFSPLLLLARAYEMIRRRQAVLNVFTRYRYLWITLAVLAVYLIIQTFLGSVFLEASLFGSYQRHTGLLLYTLLGITLLTLVTRPWQRKEIHMVMDAIAIGGGMAAIFALSQLFFPTFSGDLANTLGRIYGTFGHPNYLGQYLLISIPLTLSMVLGKRMSITPGVLLAAFQVVAIFFTGNRASLIALLLCSLIIGILVLRSQQMWKKRVTYAVATLLLVGMGFFAWVYARDPGVFQRSIVTRMVLFPQTVTMIAGAPLTGYGLDTFGYVFPKYYDERIMETEKLHDTSDKAHNIILDTLAETGLAGGILLVILLTCVFFMGVKAINGRKMTEFLEITVILCIFGMLIVSHMTGFPTVAERYVVTVLLAFLLILLMGSKKITAPLRSAGGTSTLYSKNTDTSSQSLSEIEARSTGNTTVHQSTQVDREISQGEVVNLPVWYVWIKGVVILLLSAGLIWLAWGMGYADYSYKLFRNVPTQQQWKAMVSSPASYEYRLFGGMQILSAVDVLSHFAKLTRENPRDPYPTYFLGEGYRNTGNFALALDTFVLMEAQCPSCIRPHLRQAEVLYAMDEWESSLAKFETVERLYPSFLREPYDSLTAYQKERYRIVTKESGAEVKLVLGRMIELRTRLLQPVDADLKARYEKVKEVVDKL